MKYSVVYSSKTGNTKALAEHIKNILPSGECEYFGEADKKALDADMIFAGLCDTHPRSLNKKNGFISYFAYDIKPFFRYYYIS